MPASASDKLRKATANFSQFVGAGGITDSATTLPLTSVAGLPTDTAISLTIDGEDVNGNETPALKETVIGIVSGTNLTNLIRGVEGTAQAHSAGAVVQHWNIADDWNDHIDHHLIQHNQDGTHSTVTATTLTVTGAVSMTGAINGGGGLLKDTQYFTSSGTWTKPTGLKFVIVEGVGGGGGSGGTGGTGATAVAYAGGGAGGGYFYKKILAASLGATETVTIGAAGTAGTNAPGNGGAGGTTSFGAHCSATGGGGGFLMNGQPNTDPQFPAAAVGGVGSNGDLNLAGEQGRAGQGGFNGGGRGVCGGGGSSRFGTGGVATSQTSTASFVAGNAGTGYGAGASAPGSGHSQTAKAGSAGTAGIVIVHEFF